MCQRRNEREIKTYVETNKNENTMYQNLQNSKSSSKKDIHSNKHLH